MNPVGAVSPGLGCRIVIPRQGRPETAKSPRTQTSLGDAQPLPNTFPPIPAPQPLASSVVHASHGPTAPRRLAPDSGRRCWRSPEAPRSSPCCPPATRTRRAATCSTNSAGLCADAAGCGRRDPALPSVRRGSGSPKARITPSPRAHNP